MLCRGHYEWLTLATYFFQFSDEATGFISSYMAVTNVGVTSSFFGAIPFK